MTPMQAINLAIEQGKFVLYVSYVLIGLGAFIIARMLVQEQEARAASEALDARNRKPTNPLVKLSRPIFNQYITPTIRGKKFWENARRKYKRKIIAAGVREELTPDEFIAFKWFMILFFPLALFIYKVIGEVDISWVFFAAFGGIGWFYPDYWVRTRIQARQKKILAALPFIVDLLTLSTEAGLDFVGAIQKVVEKATSSPLIEELDQFLKEIKVGSSRAEALREMAARIDMSEVNSFIAILISADQMGASIGKILRQQSEQIRGERMIRAEKAGALATQKLFMPIMLFIVPAVFIIIIAPLVLGYVYPNGQ